jgi:hypothetical protein
MPLVTMEDVKSWCEVDHDNDDQKLEEISIGASEIMLNYLKKPVDYWQDTAGLPEGVPGSVRYGTLKVAAALYENRDGSGPAALSQDIKDMVHRYRDPALA